MQTFMQKIKIAFCGEAHMRSWAEIEEEREKIRNRMTDEQITDVKMRMSQQDFNGQLGQIVISELPKSDLVVCSLLGLLAAIGAWKLDASGKTIEGFINDKVIKDPSSGEPISIGEFDKNNIFDIKRGANHREQIFHCGNLFKSVPADFIMPDGLSIDELMGQGKSTYKLIEMITQKYGLSGSLIGQATNIIKIMGVHYMKDIVTPAGLPLPFSDIFTKFIPQPSNACGYATKNALYDGFLKEVNYELRLLHVKASDISSFVLIKVFCSAYCKLVHQELEKKARKSLEKKMVLAASGFLMISQLLILCVGKVSSPKGVINGGKINPLIAVEAVKSSLICIHEANKNHRIIMDIYHQKSKIIQELLLDANFARV